MVGAGIFITRATVQFSRRSALWVFPMCGVLCFIISLCFAEMGECTTRQAAHTCMPGGIRAVCGVFGGLDDVAFVHHWLGLGR